MSAAPHRCQTCSVRDTALCASLNDFELSALNSLGRRKLLPAGEALSWAGESSATCGHIVDGALKLTASTADGREQIVGLLFPGDFVGQLFAEQNSLTITTLIDTDICLYPRGGFERLLETYPRMERMLLERTMSSLDSARERMLSLGRKNAQERVAGFLLELAEHTGAPDDSGGVRVAIPISRGEMADFLGLTIETVSRQLTRLKSADIITFAKGERDCTIIDLTSLKNLVNPL